jgi:hypothetical protein
MQNPAANKYAGVLYVDAVAKVKLMWMRLLKKEGAYAGYSSGNLWRRS